MSLTRATYAMVSGSVVNVLDYGADPNGVQDSTAAIQAAIDFAETKAANGAGPGAAFRPGGIVFFPAGNYLVSSSVNLDPTKAVSLLGEGSVSRLRWNGAPNSIIVKLDGAVNSEYRQTFIQRLYFDGNGIAGITAIALNENGVYIVNLQILENFFRSCSTAVKSTSEVDQVSFAYNYVLAYERALDLGGPFSSNWYVENNHFDGGSATSYAVHHKGGANFVFEKNTVQSGSLGASCVYLQGVGGFRIVGTYFEVAGAGGGSAGGQFLEIQSSRTGFIGNNFTTGAIGSVAKPGIMMLNAGVANVTIDQHRHGTSGGTPAYFLVVESTVTGVGITGVLDAQGASIASFMGPVDFSLQNSLSGLGPAFTFITPEVLFNKTTGQYRSQKNVAGSTTDDLLDLGSQYGAWLVIATNTNDNYWAANLFFSNGSTLISYEIYKTNANFVLSASGTKIRVYNGAITTRTVYYNIQKVL